MNDRVRKFAALVGRHGWARALELAFYWLLRQAVDYRSAILFRLDTEEAKPSSGCGEFRWAYRPLSEVPEVLWKCSGLDRKDVDRAASSTCCFIGTTSDGDPCYFSLVSKHGFRIPGRIIAEFHGSGDAYVGDCLTLAAYRGKGIYPCGLAELAIRLRAENRKWLYLYVERENLSSIQGVEKAGFRRVAIASAFRLRGRAVRKWRPCNPAEFADWTVTLSS